MPSTATHLLRSWLPMGLIGLACLGLSVFGLVAEQSHLLASGSTTGERLESFSSGARQTGLATTTQRWFVIDCRNATILAFTSAAERATRDAVAERCLAGALAITDLAPASSFAWFGAAHAALALQQWEAMNHYLARSYAAGMQEGWIARYRAELTIDNLAHVSEDNQLLLQADLKLLAGNMDNYGSYLAALYLGREGLRPLLTNVVETRPAADQTRFINIVNRLRRQPTGGDS